MKAQSGEAAQTLTLQYWGKYYGCRLEKNTLNVIPPSDPIHLNLSYEIYEITAYPVNSCRII